MHDASGSDAAAQPERPRRPGRYASLTGFLDASEAQLSTDHRAEVAAATAAAVVAQGRGRPAGVPEDDFVCLADRVGLDTLTQLWRDSGSDTLPGALWALYVVRHWCRSDGEGVARLWRAGEALAPAEAVIAGVAASADADDIARFADAALAGVYSGDVAVALERMAGFLRVVAMGRRWYCDASAVLPADITTGPQLGPAGVGADSGADRNDRTAAALTAAAARWRAGTLH